MEKRITASETSSRRLTSFYSLEDFEQAHEEVVDMWIRYKREKQDMTVAQLCSLRDDLCIVGGQIADMDVDLYFDFAMLKVNVRKRELEERERLEAEYRAKKVTGAVDKARYMAERLVVDDKVEEALAKAIHLRALNLYSFTIPEMLKSIASRINALVRTMPIGTPPEDKGGDMPSMGKYMPADDDFDNISRKHGFTATGDELLDDDIYETDDKASSDNEDI